MHTYIIYTAAISASPEVMSWLKELEKLELALTSKFGQDVWVLVTAFLAKPRGLVDEVIEALIE